MHSSQLIVELIKQCDFSNEDPFEINQNLFPSLKNLLPINLIKHIETECYGTWLNWAFEGESTVSVLYQLLRDGINNNTVDYFSHLSDQEKQDVDRYFEDIILEERGHRLIFKNIIDKLELPSNINYRPEFFDPDSETFKSYWEYQFNKLGFLFTLAIAVVGESYLLACFSLFYKQSTCPAKKEIFKQFLVDESQHISHFLNLIKSGQYSDDDRELLHHSFIQTIQQKINFEIVTVKEIYNKLHKTVDQKINNAEQFSQLAYSGDLHNSFKELFLRRSFQFYNAIFQDVTEEEFLSLVNTYRYDKAIRSETPTL